MTAVTWTDYGNTDLYSTILPGLQNRLKNLLKQDFASDTNLPTGAQRLDPTTGKRQSWNGSAWGDLFIDNIRQSNNNPLKWRNAANNADLTILNVNSSNQAIAYLDYIYSPAAGFTLATNTADGADTGMVCLTGGGGYDWMSAGRGANILLFGNEYASPSLAGNLYLSSGAGAGGQILFNTVGTQRWAISSAGHLTPNGDITYDLGTSGGRVRNLYVQTIYDVSTIRNNKTNENLLFQTVTAGTGILFQPEGVCAWIMGGTSLIPWATDKVNTIGSSGGRLNTLYSDAIRTYWIEGIGDAGAVNDLCLAVGTGRIFYWYYAGTPLTYLNSTGFSPWVNDSISLGDGSHNWYSVNTRRLSSDDNLTLNCPTGKSLVFNINSASQWQITSTALRPSQALTGTLNLGSTAARVKRGYFKEGIDSGADEDIAIYRNGVIGLRIKLANNYPIVDFPYSATPTGKTETANFLPIMIDGSQYYLKLYV